MVIKTTTYCPNPFSCVIYESKQFRDFDFRPFFSHIQCLGAVRGFWLSFYGGKGPYLGAFPILQYKRPQGEEGFFLEISNLGWLGFAKPNFGGRASYKGTGCREVGWTQKTRRRTGNWLDSNADALNGEKQGSDFCDVSFTICVPGVIKIGENWSIWFLWSFMYPGSWKFEKIEAFDFFVNFVYPGSWESEITSRVHKINKIQIIQFSPIFMTPGTRNFTKIKCFNFLKFSWTRVH